MKITTLTCLFSLFSIVFIIKLINDFRGEKIEFKSFVLWAFIGAGIGFFSLFPQSLNSIMLFSQMKNRMFFIFIISIFILFILLFNTYSRIEKLEKKVVRLVQENTLMNCRLSQLDAKRTTDS